MPAFVQPYWFHIELAPPALMDFIAKTSPDVYFLMPAERQWYYGIVSSEDVVEYLLNEFRVLTFERVEPDIVRDAAGKPGCKSWGNSELTLL